MAGPVGLMQAKQIAKYLIAQIYMSGNAVAASSTSLTITAALTSSLVGLPVQVANSVPADPQGVIVAGNNIAAVRGSSTKLAIMDAAGNEVFSRVTQSGGVYTATFFVNLLGTETAYTFVGATNIDLLPLYNYSFGNLPNDALIAVPERYVDPTGGGGLRVKEIVTVTGVNLLANAANSPNLSKIVTLFVNGQELDNIGGTPAFTVAGAVVTWSAANAGFSLAVSDRVILDYSL